MSASTLDGLLADWRERSHNLRRWGDPNCARLWALAVEELQQTCAAIARADESVTITEAAARTGYSIDHLRDLVRRGVLANAGRKGSPRVRVADLPRPKTPGGPGRPSRPRLVAPEPGRPRSSTRIRQEPKP